MVPLWYYVKGGIHLTQVHTTSWGSSLAIVLRAHPVRFARQVLYGAGARRRPSRGLFAVVLGIQDGQCAFPQRMPMAKRSAGPHHHKPLGLLASSGYPPTSIPSIEHRAPRSSASSLRPTGAAAELSPRHCLCKAVKRTPGALIILRLARIWSVIRLDHTRAMLYFKQT